MFKPPATVSFLLFWCGLMPSLLGGVQNPPAPAKSLGRFRSDRENRPAACRRAEKRRFREISPLFSRLTFSDFHRSIFDFSSSRRIRTTENALFHELNTERKRPEGLEPTTGFQILPVFCVRHKLFTNSSFQNRSIPSSKGIEPANFQKTIDKRRLL